MCNISDKRLQEVIDIRKKRWGGKPILIKECKEIVDTNSVLEELQTYRGLAMMRKDMLDADIGHVFGGYSKDECKHRHMSGWGDLYTCQDCGHQEIIKD